MANPTTNYGFVLPTSTDLVTDLPADFDVALQGVDTRLKALQPGTTLGDLAYSSATANTNTRLAIGSTGQVLTVSGGVPVWAAAAGGGKVLQVVQATTTTTTSVASTSYTDVGLSAAITPVATSSKVLVFTSVQFYLDINGVSKAMGVRLMRGSTDVFTDGSNFSGGVTAIGSSAVGMYGRSVVVYLDSPSTTSATTYKIQGRGNSASGTLNFQEGNSVSSIVLMEIGA